MRSLIRWPLALLLLTLMVANAACGDDVGAEGGTEAGSAADAPALFTDIGFGGEDMVSLDGGSDDFDMSEGSDAVLGDGEATAPSTCPGGPYCACTDGDGCDNGLCIDVADGKVCAKTCVDSCEPGFSCATVAGAGGDVINICVPETLRLCDPCSDSKTCKSLGIDNAACVDQGSEGAFCGTGCIVDDECPADYHCKAITTIEGASANMCVRKAADDKGDWGVCPCSKSATDAALSAPCFVEHHGDDGQLAGKCPGLRTCGAEGLSVCTAPALEVEICDGKDNDCDGKVDEDTCDDGNPCTQSACDPAQGCLVTKLDAVPCDADNDVCTENDVCSKGICLQGPPKSCDDGNVCTIAVCDMAAGCTQTADDGKPCDADSDACTVSDTCGGGSCVAGAPVTCPESTSCTSQACDKATGKCVGSPQVDGLACDDGTACTTSDACAAGKCGGIPLACNDGDACTANSCDPGSGCKTEALTGAICDDDNPCTLGDKCAAGKCNSGQPKICGDGAQCVIATCKSATGKCAYIDMDDGDPCNDGSACSANDACKSGTCLGKLLNCDDANPCTSDACDKLKGCAHTALIQACDDGDACTSADVCAEGKCAGAAVVVAKHCDDGNLCTDDDCQAQSGCSHKNNQIKCDDGSPCTAGDSCLAGKCSPGADLCECTTDDHCVAKEDGNLCNGTLFCAKAKLPYVCQIKPLSIIKCNTDGDGPCLQTQCDTKSGKCAGVAVNEGGSCDADGSVCTQSDACSGGLCKAGKLLDCNDNNPCTNDSCDKAKGCFKVVNSQVCDDGNACTKDDVCDQGKCAGKAMDIASACDDKNVCTNEACEPAKGCTHSNNQVNCDDGEVCTTGDVCAAGKCVAGPDLCGCKSDGDCANQEDGDMCNGTLFCDKSKAPYQCKISPISVVFCNTSGDGACEKTSCEPKTGKCNKKPANQGAKCDADGSVCTQSDACANGLCSPGKPLACDDGNPCTNGACDKTKGCYAVNNSGGCNDNNACTNADHCSEGKCAANPITCNDNNPCTEDFCDKDTGCKAVPNTAGCNDGSACTSADQCNKGVCSGKAIVCDDGDLCTTDGCNKATGCTTTANSVACNDGNACTASDKCSNGKCAGSSISCDDANPCTTDSCNTAKGCQSTAVANNTPCPGGKLCQAGKCTGVAVNAQCSKAYTSINDASRKITNTSGVSCDSGLATKWYRYVGATGTQIPESAPPKLRCGTHAPGWMNGKHPAVADGVVTRKICYHWSGSTCHWSNNINVVNCSSHYLYYLSKPPVCHLRYCSQ